LSSKSPQGADDFWLDDMDMLHQKGIAALDLIGLWISILWWSALNDVGM
jgi:hypothetical protein